MYYALYLTLEIESRTVADTFEHNYRTTCDTFSQLIQFKLVHNRLMTSKLLYEMDLVLDKVAQLVRCRTSNQRVAGSNPGRLGHFGRSWAKQFIPYCFSLPSCKMGT